MFYVFGIAHIGSVNMTVEKKTFGTGRGVEISICGNRASFHLCF